MSNLAKLSGEFIELTSPGPHVLLVELARFWFKYCRVLEDISREPDVRVVVLAFVFPKLFSAGIDCNKKRLSTARIYPRVPERCPFPIIAAIHGVAYELSIDIIAACDIRYAASNAVFSIKEVDVGLAADIGTLARLPKLAGNQSLMHGLAYTTRKFSAQEAKKMGLLSRVVQGGRDKVVKAALDTAKVIAAKSPIVVIGTKMVLQHARDHT
ncbi:ClpP/crotonase-like domain superfamily protein [Abortiporus biennis]